jgi:hypothetical protein
VVTAIRPWLSAGLAEAAAKQVVTAGQATALRLKIPAGSEWVTQVVPPSVVLTATPAPFGRLPTA